MSDKTDAQKVADLAMLVARLVHQVRRHDQASNTAEQAMDYLRRCDLQGSVLRSVEAARQQPITPEWCVANGAFYREPYYVFDDSVRVTVRPIGRGDAWLVFIDERMIDDWSATCVGQIEDLRKALRGGECGMNERPE